MNDLYIWLAIIIGINAWTFFGNAVEHYAYRGRNTRKGWGFFFHPCEFFLEKDDCRRKGDFFLAPVLWLLGWIAFGLKGVYFLSTIGKRLFDIIFKLKKE